MAQINVNGSAAVITSTLKLDDVLLIQKYRPDVLTLRGGEDGKEPLFKIGVATSGTGSINKFGVAFDSATHNTDGKATVTMVLPDDINGNVREYIADTIGAPKAMLDKLEAALKDTASAINAERKEIMDGIQMS